MVQATDTHRVPARPPHRPARARSGYSLFVSFMKLLLPTLAAGLIVLVVVWSQQNIDETRFRLGVSDLAPQEIDSLNMVHPRFEGTDSHDRPFSITAETANQADKTADIISLQQPRAKVTLETGNLVSLDAQSGLYRRKADLLDLKGAVSLFHDRGFELHTASARVDLKARTAVGYDPVQAQGPSGHIDSEGFQLAQNGERIKFTGKTKLVIYPGAGKLGE